MQLQRRVAARTVLLRRLCRSADWRILCRSADCVTALTVLQRGLCYCSEVLQLNTDDELSRSCKGIVESGSAITLHYTEKNAFMWAQTRAVNTAFCPANQLAITAVKSY